MALTQALATGSVATFKTRLLDRLKSLAEEFELDSFVLPVGLFLLIDKANGGDATAEEVVKRFNLIDFESRDVIDFYFLGWNRNDSNPKSKGLLFDLRAFEEFRGALRKAGVAHFGGNADLILVDAHYRSDSVQLDFSEAIHIDLSSSRQKGDFSTLGAFLQSVVETAGSLRNSNRGAGDGSATAMISDRLGLAIAKKSILDYVLEKFGKIIGAKKMVSVATKNLGPALPLKNL